jgi:UDP-glucuronate 4-epimerase
MALSLFADAMLHGRSIKVFNHGDMLRDFTFVDDIVDGILRVVESNTLPAYDVFNIGNHRSEKLLDVINVLAESLGVEPKMEMLPMQPGDVPATYADISRIHAKLGYEPTIPIEVGVPAFAAWYKGYKG